MKIIKKSLSILLALLMLTGSVSTGGYVALANGGGSYSAGDTFYYGTYPQSRVAETTALSSAAESAVWESYGYYSGTGRYYDGNMSAGDFAEFADFVLDGFKYRAVRFSAYRPYMTGFGNSNSYVDDNGYELNTVYYFKFEPIQWKVLDSDAGLVVSAKHIDSQAFNNYLKLSGDFYGDPACENPANDYDASSIKAWLNSDFYDTAFTADQKDNIAPDGSLGSVFLLSKDENTNYASIISVPTPTTYAECQGIHSYPYNGGYFRWTRTPTGAFEFPYTFPDVGEPNTGDSANYTCIGVCPAMKLSTIKNDTNVSCGTNAHNPGTFTYYDAASHKAVCQNCGEDVIAPHTWNEPEWDWTDPEKPTYSTSCSVCGADKSGAADYAWYDPHPVTLESDAYIDYYARVTLGSKTYEGSYHRVFEDSMKTARRMAFNSYINSKKLEAAALALETDGQLCAQAIADAQAQLDGLVYNQDKSYEENCAAADGIIPALKDRLAEIRTVYKAIFVADGKTVAEIPYTIETQSITAPDVPSKENFTGKWENFTLVKGGITVNAVYSPAAPDKPDFSGFRIKNYNSSLPVDYKSTIIFHTTMEAPDGYEIVWSNGAKGSECKLNSVTEKEYKISAKMVNKATGEAEAVTEEVTITVNTGFFAKIIAFFRGLFGSLPTYEDFKKK